LAAIMIAIERDNNVAIRRWPSRLFAATWSYEARSGPS
jgi:hypothetical protein